MQRWTACHWLFLIAALLFAAITGSASLSQEQGDLESPERPVNFIFLVDVSGSMVLPSTMVASSRGEKITLFEALRQALKEITQDRRLIGPKSKVSFITFGTKVAEKTGWPSLLDSEESRASLVADIENPNELQADRHGDTYMAGGLSLAYDKAIQLSAQSAPCTTTFIVMLTDGWDEPPPGAPLNIRAVAAKIVARQRELRSRLGVNTLEVRVIGLQRLPEKKAGTTTASEVAKLLGGEFLDVTRQEGTTVSDRIFKAIKRTLAGLKGRLELVDVPVLDFGYVDGQGLAQRTIKVALRSCYAEKITGLLDFSRNFQTKDQQRAIERLNVINGKSESLDQFLCLSTLRDNPISLRLSLPEVIIGGGSSEPANRAGRRYPVTLCLRCASNCQPGQYLGCFKFISTANVPLPTPYVVRVPGRLVIAEDTIRASVRKPGFFFPEPTKTSLRIPLKALVGPNPQQVLTVTIEPAAAKRKDKSGKVQDESIELSKDLMNGGKPLSLTLDTRSSKERTAVFPVSIPAKQSPGIYKGALPLKLADGQGVAVPAQIPFEVAVLPSPWEEMGPIAIPILAILVLVVLAGIFVTFTSRE